MNTKTILLLLGLFSAFVSGFCFVLYGSTYPDSDIITEAIAGVSFGVGFSWTFIGSCLNEEEFYGGD